MEPIAYWLIVRNKETGRCHNAQVVDILEDFDEVADRFEQSFPQYEVADGGRGLENRPETFKELTYIS
jgi:hypothetical protein